MFRTSHITSSLSHRLTGFRRGSSSQKLSVFLIHTSWCLSSLSWNQYSLLTLNNWLSTLLELARSSGRVSGSLRIFLWSSIGRVGGPLMVKFADPRGSLPIVLIPSTSWIFLSCQFVVVFVSLCARVSVGLQQTLVDLLENGAKDRPHRDLRQDSSQSIFFRSVHRQEYYPSSVHESHVLVDLRQTNEGKGSLWRLNPRLKLSSENLFARTAEDKDNLTLHNVLTVFGFLCVPPCHVLLS